MSIFFVIFIVLNVLGNPSDRILGEKRGDLSLVAESYQFSIKLFVDAIVLLNYLGVTLEIC